MTGIRCSHPACHSIRHHDHSIAWLAYGNANSVEICVIVFLRCLGRAVMSEPVYCRDSSMVEAEWQTGRLPHCARVSLSRTRWPSFHVAIPASLWANIHFLGFAHSVEDPLLDETPQGFHHETDDPREPTSVSIPSLLTSLELRRPLIIVSSAMISQQLSGNTIYL